MFEYNLTGEKVKAIIITDPDQIALQELSNNGLHCDMQIILVKGVIIFLSACLTLYAIGYF